jgi:hypothetical protein
LIGHASGVYRSRGGRWHRFGVAEAGIAWIKTRGVAMEELQILQHHWRL